VAQAHIYDLVTDSPASPIPVLDGKGLEHLNRQTSDGERVHICGAVMPGLIRPRYVALHRADRRICQLWSSPGRRVFASMSSWTGRYGTVIRVGKDGVS